MQRIYKFISLFSLLGVILITSCSEEKISASAEGRLALNVEIDQKIITHISPRSTTEYDYALEIVDETGNIIRQFEHKADIPPELWLPSGDYQVNVSSGNNPDAAFNQPYYYGSEKISIIPNAITSKNITCTLANAKISVQYSERIKKYFTDIRTTVKNGSNSLTYTDTTRSAGFYKTDETGITTLEWNLSVINAKGQHLTRTETLEVAARNHYIINFDINTPSTEEGGMLNFQIIINPEMEHFENIIRDTLLAIPLITGKGFDFSQQLATLFHQTEGIEITVSAEPKLESVFITHNCEYLTDQGVASSFDLKKVKPIFLNTLGVKWTNIDSTQTVLNLDELLNQLPDPESGSYNLTFSVAARSSNGKEWNETLNLLVLKSDVMTLETTAIKDIWAHHATLYGKWVGSNAPSEVTFQYQLAGGNEEANDNWEETDPITPEADGSFSYTITGLKAGSVYNYRAKAGNVPANKYKLTTEKIVEIPNLSFDEWTQNGATWYPNSTADYSYWATGNEGVTSSLAGSKPSNSVPVEGNLAVKGKAAQLTSIGGVSVVGVAAGNLFTGTYATNASDKEKSVNFGRDYDGARPTKLKGWYRYMSTPISHAGDPDTLKNDMCHIYIWLKDKDGNQIAYGELSNSRRMDNYEEFTIDIQYSNLNVYPGQIAIIATSSRYGGKFASGLFGAVTGAVGEGSVLWLDELELIYE